VESDTPYAPAGLEKSAAQTSALRWGKPPNWRKHS